MHSLQLSLLVVLHSWFHQVTLELTDALIHLAQSPRLFLTGQLLARGSQLLVQRRSRMAFTLHHSPHPTAPRHLQAFQSAPQEAQRSLAPLLLVHSSHLVVDSQMLLQLHHGRQMPLPNTSSLAPSFHQLVISMLQDEHTQMFREYFNTIVTDFVISLEKTRC